MIQNIKDVAKILEIVKSTFDKIAETEIAYRKVKGTAAKVLDEIYQTVLFLSVHGAVDKESFDHLQKGTQRIERFIYSKKYHFEKDIFFKLQKRLTSPGSLLPMQITLKGSP